MIQRNKGTDRRRTNQKSPLGRAREPAVEYRASRRISSTEASRNFSEILNLVRYRGESFVVERGGEAICEIRPAAAPPFTGADLVAVLRSLPPVDEGYLLELEALARNQPPLPESPWER
jgi:antitoxin (DNA-binding transcriptional repressor) of toxin-antitoxin stability system